MGNSAASVRSFFSQFDKCLWKGFLSRTHVKRLGEVEKGRGRLQMFFVQNLTRFEINAGLSLSDFLPSKITSNPTFTTGIGSTTLPGSDKSVHARLGSFCPFSHV